MGALDRVRRMLEEGADGEALAFLHHLSPATPQEEAEALALKGFLLARQGDLEGYRTLALEAAQRAQTPLPSITWAWPCPREKGL